MVRDEEGEGVMTNHASELHSIVHQNGRLKIRCGCCQSMDIEVIIYDDGDVHIRCIRCGRFLEVPNAKRGLSHMRIEAKPLAFPA